MNILKKLTVGALASLAVWKVKNMLGGTPQRLSEPVAPSPAEPAAAEAIVVETAAPAADVSRPSKAPRKHARKRKTSRDRRASR